MEKKIKNIITTEKIRALYVILESAKAVFKTLKDVEFTGNLEESITESEKFITELESLSPAN